MWVCKGKGQEFREMAFSTYAVRDLHSAVLSGFTYTAFSSEGQKAGLRQELLVINLLTDLHHHFHLSCKAQPVFPLCQISVLKGSKYT